MSGTKRKTFFEFAEILILLIVIIFNIVFILLFLIGAYIRLICSRAKYEQKETDISKLRKGDIVLTGSNKNTSSFHIKLSNILTNGINSKYWTHVALHTGEGNLIEAEPRGIMNNTIKNYLDKGELVRVYRHKYVANNDFFGKVIDYCEEAKKEDYRYGWIGLSFYVLASFMPISANFIFDNEVIDKWCNLDKAYFCSELIADAYKGAGHRITPFDSWRIKPSDFMKDPFFEEIDAKSC